MGDQPEEFELRKVRKVPGAHRSKSRNTPGAERDLLRDDETGELLGPTESVPVDEEELRRQHRAEIEAELEAEREEEEFRRRLDADAEVYRREADEQAETDAEALLGAILLGGLFAAPHIKRGVNWLWSTVTEKVKARRDRDAAASQSIPVASRKPDTDETGEGTRCTDLDPAVESVTMSAEEYCARVRALDRAVTYTVRERDVLLNATIDASELHQDRELVGALQRALAGSPPEPGSAEALLIARYLGIEADDASTAASISPHMEELPAKKAKPNKGKKGNSKKGDGRKGKKGRS